MNTNTPDRTGRALPRLLLAAGFAIGLPLASAKTSEFAAAAGAPAATPSAAKAEAFERLSLEQAQALAEKSGRLVFVDFFTTWCGPCKMLDETTWRDAAVVALLREKTVAIRVDAEPEADLARRYKVTAYPTLVLLKPDGTEVDRWVGYLKPEAFASTLAATIAGKNSIQQEREKLSGKAEKDPRARLSLARKLIQSGATDEALEHLLWVYDSGPDMDPMIGTMLRKQVPSLLYRLGRTHGPAREAFAQRREELADQVFADPSKAALETVALLSAFDRASRKEAVILETLAKLPEGGRARKTYGDMEMFTFLVGKGKHALALTLLNPESEYERYAEKITQVTQTSLNSGRPVPEGFETNQKRGLAAMSSVFVIALAGGGERERAQQLHARILSETKDPDARAAYESCIRGSPYAWLLGEPLEKTKEAPGEPGKPVGGD